MKPLFFFITLIFTLIRVDIACGSDINHPPTTLFHCIDITNGIFHNLPLKNFHDVKLVSKEWHQIVFHDESVYAPLITVNRTYHSVKNEFCQKPTVEFAGEILKTLRKHFDLFVQKGWAREDLEEYMVQIIYPQFMAELMTKVQKSVPLNMEEVWMPFAFCRSFDRVLPEGVMFGRPTIGVVDIKTMSGINLESPAWTCNDYSKVDKFIDDLCLSLSPHLGSVEDSVRPLILNRSKLVTDFIRERNAESRYDDYGEFYRPMPFREEKSNNPFWYYLVRTQDYYSKHFQLFLLWAAEFVKNEYNMIFARELCERGEGRSLLKKALSRWEDRHGIDNFMRRQFNFLKKEEPEIEREVILTYILLALEEYNVEPTLHSDFFTYWDLCCYFKMYEDWERALQYGQLALPRVSGYIVGVQFWLYWDLAYCAYKLNLFDLEYDYQTKIYDIVKDWREDTYWDKFADNTLKCIEDTKERQWEAKK